MQRLSLHLGHPLRALAVGLTTFLLGSGLGSALTARTAPGREVRLAVGSLLAVCILLALHAALLPALLGRTLAWGDAARTAVAVAAVAPLAVAMGMPFPLGLRVARARAAPLLPWAFGVNGASSVVASVLAILVAMGHGFSFVLWGSAAVYAAAALAFPAAPAERR